MASTKLRAFIAVLLCTALFLVTSQSVVFGQDLDKREAVPTHVESVSSLQKAIAEGGRIAAMAGSAELIALGEVTHSHSFWSEDAAIIETETTITLNRLVKGDAPAEVLVRSEGGFIADDNIGMVAPHEASFVVGEEVMIFAHKQGDFYRIQDGAAGRLSIGSRLVDDDFSSVTDASLAGDIIEHSVRASAAASAAASHSPAIRRWRMPDATVAFRINVNTTQKDADNTADAFLNAIASAAATWNQTPGADFTLEYAGATHSTRTGYNHVNEVVFVPKGRGERGALAQVWYTSDLTIVEADIWINDDFTWDVGGELPQDRLDLQSAVLHEFGHWLILNHTEDSTSVMYPTLAPGATKRQLARRDAEGISAIYPCRQAACVFGH